MEALHAACEAVASGLSRRPRFAVSQPFLGGLCFFTAHLMISLLLRRLSVTIQPRDLKMVESLVYTIHPLADLAKMQDRPHKVVHLIRHAQGKQRNLISV